MTEWVDGRHTVLLDSASTDNPEPLMAIGDVRHATPQVSVYQGSRCLLILRGYSLNMMHLAIEEVKKEHERVRRQKSGYP